MELSNVRCSSFAFVFSEQLIDTEIFSVLQGGIHSALSGSKFDNLELGLSITTVTKRAENRKSGVKVEKYKG